MKKLLLLTLSLVFTAISFGQPLSSYNFSAFSSTYTSVTTPFITTPSGTTWGSTTWDDPWYPSIPIGFNFVYNCNTYTSLTASQNCWLVLGQTFPGAEVNTYDDDLANTIWGGLYGGFNLPRPILAALWNDVISTGPCVRYATTGLAPNRIFTIEWDSVGFFSATAGPRMSVEIILYETTNIIDFAYTQIASATPSLGHMAIGITGGSGPSPVTGAQPFWSLNNASAAPTPSMSVNTTSIVGLPATNQVYEWNPNCTGTPSPGTITATVTASCSPFSSTVSVPACNPLGITLQWQSSPDGVTGWANVPGATNSTYTTSVTATIYYRCMYTCTNSGLSASTAAQELILNSPPAPIAGTISTLCVGSSTTLTDATTGGSWVSSNTAVATVTSSGLVGGASVGSANISYVMPAGCYVIYPVSVVTNPVGISGAALPAGLLCQHSTITLSDGTGSGTWSSSNTAVATVVGTGSTSTVGGVIPGTSTITYSLGSCFTSVVVTVNPAPAAIGGTLHVCGGLTTQLTDATTGGTWSVNTAYATVGTTSGLVTGNNLTFTTFTPITYYAPGGCSISSILTVNALAGLITGIPVVCPGQTIQLNDAGGGTWSSSSTLLATVGSTGIVTGVAPAGGTVTITYTLPSGCDTTTQIAVATQPGPITGTRTVCEDGGTTTLGDGTPGGFWQSINSGITITDPTVGIITGGTAGTDTITYSVTTSLTCFVSAVVTVNPLPPAIIGTSYVCTGSAIQLSDGITGGTWSSDNSATASVGSTSGTVTGGALTPPSTTGFATITYTAPSGCATTFPVILNGPPNPITGVLHVCVGQSTTLGDLPGGGGWGSGNTMIAIVSASGGVVTGISPGLDTITYTQLGTSCTRTTVVTVNGAPGPITVVPAGPAAVCVGSTIQLNDATSGGSWISSNTLIATVGSSSGVAGGVLNGTVTITYSTGGTCVATALLTVNPIPLVFTVTGGGSYCSGNPAPAIGLSGSTVGIHYQLLLGGVPLTPTVSVTGTGSAITFGPQSAGGTYTVIATNALTGCNRTMTGSATVTLTTPPTLYTVTGGGAYCAGGTGVHIGLSGSTSGVTYILHNGATTAATVSGTGAAIDFGLFTGAGTYTVTATSGCTATMTGSVVVTISPLPTAYNVTGSGSICPGSTTGVTICLSNSTTGVSYQLYLAGVAVGTPVAGVGASVCFPPQTTAGVYTVVATNTATGCTKAMTGSATISLASVPTISGPSTVCPNASIPLLATGFSGTWSSSNTGVATVTTTGTVGGVAVGTATITFTTSAGCIVTDVINVTSAPQPITGPATVCANAQVTEIGTPSGGAWSPSTGTIATVVASGSAGGLVTGIAPGTVTIVYSLGGSSCTVSRVLTVTPAPSSITGSLNLCANATTTLTDGAGGGTWTSLNTGIASVSATTATTATITGLTAGTSTVIYTLGGCTVQTTVTVNNAPGVISGPSTVCAGSTIDLTDGPPGGTWTSSNTSVASVSATTAISATIEGIIGGTSTITYSLGGSCVATHVVTVSPITPISGITGLCISNTGTLTDLTAGGTWHSGNTAVATLGAVSGSSITVYGASSGTSIITYTTSAGCTAMTTVTVNAAPSLISGTLHMCNGSCTTLVDTVLGGTWTSSNTGVAVISTVTPGLVCGTFPGTSVITYSLGFGCTHSVTVTVNGLPSAITGASHACSGTTASVSNPATGGTWSSGNTIVASFSNPLVGTVTAVSAGTATLIYTPPTGCPATTVFTVNAPPPGIGGPSSVCVGLCITLTDGASGGTWSSSNTAVANAGSGGTVCGLTPGVSTIIYNVGGCTTSQLITVQAGPPPIGGPLYVCAGQSAQLTDGTTGGTWSTGPASLATINGSTGVLWGVASGTVIVSYTAGCPVFRTIIVDALSPITGSATVCQGLSETLTDTTGSGSWSSSNGNAIAVTTGVYTGLIGGVTAGTDTIIYTLPTGCSATLPITVNAAPPAISGIAGVCVGSTTTLSDATSGGTWVSSNMAAATVNASGVVTGVAYGITTITYTVAGTGCPAIVQVTVSSVPPGISGPSSVCLVTGDTITLSDAVSGGTWTVTPTSIAVINLVTGQLTGLGTTAGTATVLYTIGSGCSASATIGVNPPPPVLIGPGTVCPGATITLNDAVSGGTWSSSTGAATVDGFGNVTGGTTGGTTIISYATAPGCAAVATITVNPEPGAIIGGPNLCQGIPTTLTDATAGGTWSSDNTLIPIGSTTGIVTPTDIGSALITFTAPTGCSVVTAVNVNTSPDPIGGSPLICQGFTITLTETSFGGDWSSDNTLVATVDPFGNVFGDSAGTATISYSSGVCAATLVVTVNAAPGAITGNPVVCTGATTTLGDIPGGGIWTSSDASIATIDSFSGTVTGVSPTGGSAGITYSLGAGCTTYTIVVVNPAPSAIVTPVPFQVCTGGGSPAILYDATTGGIWSSSNGAVAVVIPAGEVFGAGTPGTATIAYTLGTGCAATAVVTVHQLPAAITGLTNICLGSTRTLSDAIGGGTWSSGNTAIASVLISSAGVVSGVSVGSATIIYSLGFGCTQATNVSVIAPPQTYTVTGGNSYCAGGAGVPIGLNGSQTDVNYLLYHGTTPTGTFAGTGTTINFGLQTVAGPYTVIAISTTSGCTNVMSGSVTVVVNPNITPSVSISATPGNTVCTGTATTFTAVPVNGGTGAAYVWNVNGTDVSTGLTYAFVPADSDVVTVTLSSDAPCVLPATASGNLRMTVLALELPVAGVLATPGDTVCRGGTVTVTAQPLYGGATPSYMWLKNGVSASPGSSYTYIPEDGDVLQLSLTSDYLCRLTNTVLSNPVTISVDTPYLPLVTINAKPGTSVAIGQFDTLIASAAGAGTNLQYQWVVNELPVAGATTNTYISNNFRYPSEDSVTCIVTSGGVCSATSFGWLYVSIHPEGVTNVTAGVEDIAIIPNPNKGSFTVKGTLGTTTDEAITLELTDMLGRQLYSEQAKAVAGRINERIQLSSIANGMYLLNLRTTTGNKVFHIVVEQ